MKIKAAKHLAFIHLFTHNLFFSVPIIYFFLHSSSLQNTLIIMLTINLFICTIYTLSSNWHIEITEDQTMIGGETLGVIKNGKKQFISEQSLDKKRSLKRNLYQRITGQFRVYDKNGKGFGFNSYYFTKKDFELIQEKFSTILGITID
ncbi:hypothetical protein [Aliikangiella maris]|uniref:Uncharacterized protein n=2 Tax=Aliikangiella maris TaxID=3162458 RepID=A0ABV2C065_9GAMM